MSRSYKLFLLFVCNIASSFCGNIYPYFEGLQMGIGADYETGRTFGTALEKTDTKVEDYADGQKTEWKLTQVTSSQQVNQALGITTSLSLNIYQASASASVSFAESSNVNKYSTHLLVQASVKNAARNIPRPALSQEAKEVLSQFGMKEFEKFYGIEYLGGVISGGMYLGMISVHTQTTSEKQSIVSGVKFSGYGSKVELDLSASATSIMQNRRVEVYGVQVGGQSQSLATNLYDMIQQLKVFPSQVLQYPVPIEGIFHKYQDTIPFNWQGKGTDYKVRDKVLQALGARISTLKDRSNDLQYVKNNYNSFKSLKIKLPKWKNQELKQLQKEINEIITETNIINEVAVDCISDTAKCVEPTSIYVPVFQLPNQPDGQLSESIGMAMMFFGNFSDIPFGWQLCDGSTRNGIRTPDLRGRFPVGYTQGDLNGDRIITNSIGQTGGYTKKKLSTSEMPQHTHITQYNGSHTHTMQYDGYHHHNVDDFFHSDNYYKDYIQMYWDGPKIGSGTTDFDNDRFYYQTHHTHKGGSHIHTIYENKDHNHVLSQEGSNQAFDIVNPYAAVYFICKMQ